MEFWSRQCRPQKSQNSLCWQLRFLPRRRNATLPFYSILPLYFPVVHRLLRHSIVCLYSRCGHWPCHYVHRAQRVRRRFFRHSHVVLRYADLCSRFFRHSHAVLRSNSFYPAAAPDIKRSFCLHLLLRLVRLCHSFHPHTHSSSFNPSSTTSAFCDMLAILLLPVLVLPALINAVPLQLRSPLLDAVSADVG